MTISSRSLRCSTRFHSVTSHTANEIVHGRAAGDLQLRVFEGSIQGWRRRRLRHTDGGGAASGRPAGSTHLGGGPADGGSGRRRAASAGAAAAMADGGRTAGVAAAEGLSPSPTQLADASPKERPPDTSSGGINDAARRLRSRGGAAGSTARRAGDETSVPEPPNRQDHEVCENQRHETAHVVKVQSGRNARSKL